MKPVTEFYTNKGEATSRCKRCVIELNAETRKQLVNDHVYRAKRSGILRKSRLKRRYGLGLEDYHALASAQNNGCAICKKETKLVVDHCHNTGKVRGLLCNNCNTALGSLKDNIVVLHSAIRYLQNG